MTEDKKRKPDLPPAVQQRDPDAKLEEKVEANPEDSDAKVDIGSDESMDASDPPSAVQPSHDEPAPSSGSPDERDR